MARTIQTAGVIGLGTMGAGIVEVFARAGLQVVGVEADPASVQRGRAHIDRSTGRAVERGRLDAAERQAIFDRIGFGTEVGDLAGADLVIEAIPERLDLKQAVFAELDRLCRPEAILASNTSSLSVTELAANTGRPARVLGMHFFNPAPVMKLVEVITTVVTDEDAVAAVKELARRLGKTPVTVRDRAGFVANALLFGYLNRAVGLYDAGYVGREDIDAAMTLGCGLPMGPLALLDLIGIDTAYQILRTMYAESGDPLHAPHPLLRQLTTAGLLGRKTGRGFYSYQRPGSGGAADAGASPAVTTPTSDGPVVLAGAGALADDVAGACQAAGVGVERDLRGTTGARFVLLAAEDRPDREALLAQAEQATRAGVPLAVVGTADLGVSELAARCRRPEDVVGLHLAGEGLGDRVIEVVRSPLTAQLAVGVAAEFVARLGRRPIVCAERAGLVVDALLFPHLNDAARMLDAGYATADDIDAAMTLGCGYPAGPIAMLDRIGLDVALRTQQQIYAETPQPGLMPAPLLQQLVTAGRRGVKTGQGFRSHDSEGGKR